MFHWICPECGREIAPTVRECPVCDPVAATVETALAGEVEAPARAEKDVAAPALNGSAVSSGTQPEPHQLPAPVAPATTLASPVKTVAAPTKNVAVPVKTAVPELAAPVESVSPLAARGSQRLAGQDTKDAPLPQFGAPSLGVSSGHGDPLGHLSSMLDSMRDAGGPEAPPSRGKLPLQMGGASNVPASLRAFIAELRPANAKPRIPLTPDQHRQTAPEPPLLTNRIPIPLRSSRLSPTPPLGAKLLALAVPLLQPYAGRPSTRRMELAPALAPLGNYSPLAGRPLRPSAPKAQLLKKETGPRTTLPGPMLTRRLVKFLDRELGPIAPGFLRVKKRLIPGWMATALILGTLLGAGFTSVISVVRPTADAKPSQPAQTDVAAAPITATQAPAALTASPLAKGLEVTGFRIRTDSARKSEIQYLVVNHTPTRFSDVTVYVTLYAADAKAGQPPLCRFQFDAPNLAPFQAKDMTSEIDPIARPVTLPDWQELRASVEVGQ